MWCKNELKTTNYENDIEKKKKCLGAKWKVSVKAKIREANLQQVKIIITISYYYYCYIICIIVGSWYVIQCILFVRSHFESWWRTMKRGHDCRTNDSGFDENSIYFMCFAEFYVSFFFSAVLFLFNPMRLSWSFMRRFICKNGICPPANAPPPLPLPASPAQNGAFCSLVYANHPKFWMPIWAENSQKNITGDQQVKRNENEKKNKCSLKWFCDVFFSSDWQRFVHFYYYFRHKWRHTKREGKRLHVE